VDHFYGPVLDWLSDAKGKLSNNMNFVFDLEYFNVLSSKRILFILYHLAEIQKTGVDVSITWQFSVEDEDMKEVGEDFACMVNLPFEFVSKTFSPEFT